MGFQVPSPFKAIPTEGELLFSKSWEVFGDNVIALMDEGWTYTKMGRSDKANAKFQAANIYFYMVYTAQAARYTLEMLGILNQPCNSETIDCKYGLSCIEDNLPCLSTHFGQDYRAAWDEIMSIFDIDRDTDNCGDCCYGIGEMIVDDEDDCLSFIIGPCDDIEDDAVNDDIGEFALGQFAKGQFTNFNEE